ncbi:MAG: aminotransferase class V-fold PLP-dependent enzyme [bacterium]
MKRKDFFRYSAAFLGAMSLPSEVFSDVFTELPRLYAASDEEKFWKLIRDQFILDRNISYLNFGGLGSCPLPVINSLIEWTRKEETTPNAGHDEKEWNRVKDQLALLLGKTCRKEELALISTATEGINMIINGLPLKQGDEVITSTHEHVAINVGLLNRMQRDGIVIRLFEPDLKDAMGNVDRIASLINSRTRLILISHVTCTTGQREPLPEISKLAREKGIWFAVDGAQAPVCVPFDIVECGADFYTASTHKWVMGPKRTGFLYVRKGMLDTLRPITVGAYSSEKDSIRTNELVLHPNAQRYEYGTQNDALFFALGTALDFVHTIGPDRIWKHNHALAQRFYEGLKDIPGTDIVSPEEEDYRSSMISFRMKNIEYAKVNEHLSKDKLRIRTVTEGGVNCIRVSFHICNDDEDVTKILNSVKILAG